MKHTSYGRSLLLTMLLMVWGPVVCFLVFQHQRERSYKYNELNNSLQLLNLQIGIAVDNGEAPAQIFSRYSPWFDGLRLTLIDGAGRVTYDSHRNLPLKSLGNHAGREEMRDALRQGSGYAMMRVSESTHQSYFYAATRHGNFFVRTALPYTPTLRSMLRADNGPLLLILLVALVFTAVAWLRTRSLSHTIARLRLFALRLEKGESVRDMEPFPHNEIGEISNHIVQLSARLQQATSDLKEEYARSLYEEQDKARIKRRLTNNINHELKTPIAAVKGYLESILQNPDTPPDMKQRFLEKSYEQTERMQQLLQDVLTLSRLDDGGRAIEKTSLSMRRIIEDCIADHEPRIRQLGYTVTLRMEGDVTVSGNERLLHSIFSNLIDNALSYSGGDHIVIKLRRVLPKACVFTFHDNGSGIPEGHLPHLFERFYRIDKGRSRVMGGTGLGLSIVKNAILFHGGNIEVHNRLEGGLEYTFSLSLA